MRIGPDTVPNEGLKGTTIPVLYRDDRFLAVDKPAGLLVHRTRLSRDREVLLQRVRDQEGVHLFPVHRLDRATSGVVLFALQSQTAAAVAEQFRDHTVEKVYWAVVRGYAAQEAVIDHPLRSDAGNERKAVTRYRCLDRVELPYPMPPHPTARYSLVEVRPETGRKHQIRRHLRHISHKLIGDTTYGEGRHNRFFRETLSCGRLLLHARHLAVEHPDDGRRLCLEAPLPADMVQLFRTLGWEDWTG